MINSLVGLVCAVEAPSSDGDTSSMSRLPALAPAPAPGLALASVSTSSSASSSRRRFKDDLGTSFGASGRPRVGDPARGVFCGDSDPSSPFHTRGRLFGVSCAISPSRSPPSPSTSLRPWSRSSSCSDGVGGRRTTGLGLGLGRAPV